MRERKTRKKGSVVFYSVYLIGILVFFMVLAALLTPLNDWLVRYEAAQPNHKRDEVFMQLEAQIPEILPEAEDAAE